MSPPPSPPIPKSIPNFTFTAFSLFILFSIPKPTPNHLFHLKSLTLNPNKSFSFFPKSSSTMSIPNHKRNPNSKKHQFPTPQSLSDWLSPRLPSDSFASWGIKPGTKNIHNLWLELSEGETSLADSTPPIRTLDVVIVRIISKTSEILIESHQELSDGSIRSRSRPLSEKMKPDETVESAVVRAVKEELGSIIGNDIDYSGIVKILPNSYRKKVEERVSVSYPGLPACYVLHSVDALVEGLPEGEFCTEEGEGEEYGDCDGKELAEGAVSCRKHYWKWVDSDLV